MSVVAHYLKRTFGRPEVNRDAIEQVKAWVRSALEAGPDTNLAVNEIACTDPSCPGVETVILVMEPGVKTRAVKIQKPLDAVREPDIRSALEA